MSRHPAASEFLSSCGYIGLVVTVNEDGTASGVTDPQSETFDNETIQACFQAAELTPEVGTYQFELYGDGTSLAFAPSDEACELKERLEKAVDARITQPLLARLRGAQESTLPSDAGGGMHGEGLHGTSD